MPSKRAAQCQRSQSAAGRPFERERITRATARALRSFNSIELRRNRTVERAQSVTNEGHRRKAPRKKELGPAPVQEDEPETEGAALVSTPHQTESLPPVLEGVDLDHAYTPVEEVPTCEPAPIQGPVDAPATRNEMATLVCCPTCGQPSTVNHTNSPPPPTRPVRETTFVSVAPDRSASPYDTQGQVDEVPMNRQVGTQPIEQRQKRPGEDNEAQASAPKRMKRAGNEREAELTNDKFREALGQCTIVLRHDDVRGEVLDALLKLDSSQRDTISRRIIVWTRDDAERPVLVLSSVSVGLTGPKVHFQKSAYPDKLFTECQVLRNRPSFLLTLEPSKPFEFVYHSRCRAWTGNCSEVQFKEIVAFSLEEEQDRTQSADDIDIGTFRTGTWRDVHAFIKGKSQQFRIRIVIQQQMFRWSKGPTEQKFIDDICNLIGLTVLCEEQTSARDKKKLRHRNIQIVAEKHSTSRRIGGFQLNNQALLDLRSTTDRDMLNIVFISLGGGTVEDPLRWCEDGVHNAYVIGRQHSIAYILRKLMKDQGEDMVNRHGDSGEHFNLDLELD